MVVGLLSVELYIAEAQSLKDKRMVVRRVKERLKKFNVSIAELGHQDLWQRAALGIVTISNGREHADRELAAVVQEIDRVEPGRLTRSEVEFLA